MPSYLVVAQAILGRIAAGEWRQGDRLPTTEQLAAEYDVSPSTILHAMRYLGILRKIRTVQGGGRYVAGDDNDEESTGETGTED